MKKERLQRWGWSLRTNRNQPGGVQFLGFLRINTQNVTILANNLYSKKTPLQEGDWVWGIFVRLFVCLFLSTCIELLDGKRAEGMENCYGVHASCQTFLKWKGRYTSLPKAPGRLRTSSSNSCSISALQSYPHDGRREQTVPDTTWQPDLSSKLTSDIFVKYFL